MTKSAKPKKRRTGSERCRPPGRQAGRRRPAVGAVQLDRHPPLGDGDGLSQPAPLGPGVRPRVQVRRHRRAAVDRGRARLRPWRPAGLRRQIPGTHLIFGGEEWWFYGMPVRPGDKLFQERRFHDYKVADTKFAGPTMFSRGDTVHRNQHGALVAKERSTAIRYLAEEADEARHVRQPARRRSRRWTPTSWRKSTRLRHEWLMSNRDGRLAALRRGEGRRQAAAPGDRPAHASPASPPSTARSCSTSGAPSAGSRRRASRIRGSTRTRAGSRTSASTRRARRSIRASATASTSARRAATSTPTRPAKSAWRGLRLRRDDGRLVTDYLAYWAGHDGMVRHTKADFRGPAFEGDVTYFDGEVVDKRADRPGACRSSR